jgi:Putative bacterial sensory transduction regulator
MSRSNIEQKIQLSALARKPAFAKQNQRERGQAMLKTILFGTALTLSAQVIAEDVACAKDMICASDPMTVVAAMQAEGYRAKLTKDKLGEPMIESKTNGYDFDVLFYDCEDGKACKAIQFSIIFKPEDDNTPEYANAWNVGKRFIKASATDKKSLELQYDLTTVGGLNQANFADALDWWATMLGEFAKFVEARKPKAN